MKRNSGQIVLMLVLIIIVGLTIALSLISRTITDIRLSSQIEQSGRAFSAAEAGVETALKSASGSTQNGTVQLPGASANYSVSTVGGSASVISFPITEVGSSQTLWLIDHNTDGTLNESGSAYSPTANMDICFGNTAGTNPAVIVSIYYKEGTTYKVAKKAYDSTSRSNNFTLADTSGGYCDGSFNFKKTIAATSDFGINSGATLLALTLQPVYNNTALAVKPVSSLPVQGSQITSVGQTNTGVVRKVQVIQGYPVLPEIFNFSFFCENNCL